MSNKTRLQTNNTNLQSLIDKANALPDAGSGGSGSGSVETCTVNIDMDNARSTPCYCCIAIFENSELSLAWVSESSVITNAIKNSLLYVFYPEDIFIDVQPNPAAYINQVLDVYSADGMAMVRIDVQICNDVTTITFM